MRVIRPRPRRASPWLLVGVAIGLALAHLPDVGRADPQAASPLAHYGGQVVQPRDLAAWWFERYPQEYRQSLDDLLDLRIAKAAAARWGLAVPPALLEDAVTKEVQARQTLLAETHGAEATLAAWVEAAYGVSVDRWRAGILGPRVEGVLLVQRVIRASSRRRAQVHARVLVVAEAARARALRAKVERGADFSLLARQASQDATARVGGTLPPLVRGDLAAHPEVERALFEAPAGTLVGPLEVREGGRTWWHLYKVMRRDAPWSFDREDLPARLEQDLQRHPVGTAERNRWRASLRAEGRVRYLTPDGAPWVPARWR